MGIVTIQVVTCDICNKEISSGISFLDYSDYGIIFHKGCAQEMAHENGIEEFLKFMNMEPTKHWSTA